MRDDLISNLFPVHGQEIDPVEMARRDLQKKWPKRFYAQATIERRPEGHVLLLDGRAAKTPARAIVALANEAVAAALAAEWNAQQEVINPLNMPLTRLVNSALDGVAREAAAVRAEIARFAGSDLVCYRAEGPEALRQAQSAAWDPVLDFAAQVLDARFICVQGLMPQPQPEQALQRVAQALDGFDEAVRLAALNVVTTISGSALIGLALALGHHDAERAFNAACVDEDYQRRVWGEDEEATARRAHRKRDFEIAAFVLAQR